MRWIDALRAHARSLKNETHALYFAARHPETPWYAKLLVAAIVAYALSPIDLIPDFIPVLGYLDDLVLLPLGIAWAIRMIPAGVMTECRDRVQSARDGKPVSWVAAGLIALIWLVALAGLFLWASRSQQWVESDAGRVHSTAARGEEDVIRAPISVERLRLSGESRPRLEIRPH